MSSLREQFFNNPGMGFNPFKELLEADAPLPMLPTGGVDGAGNNGLGAQPGVGPRGPGPGQLGLPGQTTNEAAPEEVGATGITDEEYQQVQSIFADALVKSVEYDLDSDYSPYEAPSSDSPGDPGMYYATKCVMLPHGREVYLKTYASDERPNGVDYTEMISELMGKTDAMPRGFALDTESGEPIMSGNRFLKELQRTATDYKTGKYNGIAQYVAKNPDSMAVLIRTDEEPEADSSGPDDDFDRNYDYPV